MILVWGPREDPPIERVLSGLAERTDAAVHLDDADLADLRFDLTIASRPAGWLEVDGERVEVERLRGVYLRPGAARNARAANVATTLLAVVGCLPATVVNRPSAGRSNWSKPYQLSLLRGAGFRVPDTLVTSDPVSAKQFLADHERVVYKSVSGVRSIVSALGQGEADRLDGVTTAPVQLQQWVAGTDVRAHVVGEQCFATAISSTADDYRYAHRDATDVSLERFELPPALATSLVTASRSMDLLVSGADLRLAPDGTWWAFEINPSPGFTYYEDATGQPIGAAIAELLLR